MRMYVVSVRDLAIQSYQNPFFVTHSAAAVRAFKDEVVKKDGNPLASHPEDYELHLVGEFDSEAGTFHASGIQVLIRGKDCAQLQ